MMRILVFGASGQTGREVVAVARRRQMDVSVFVRDPQSFTGQDSVRVFQGDVTDSSAVARAVRGQDAVLCALGAATPLRRDPELVTGTAHITTAMLESGVRRLVHLSFLGVPAGRHQLSVLGRWLVAPVLLRNVAADHVEKERIIEASGLDWTIVRPPRLTRGLWTGTYRHGEHIQANQVVPRVSRADVAEFMVSRLDYPTSVGRALAIMR